MDLKICFILKLRIEMLDTVKVTSDVKVNSARPRDMLNVPHRGIRSKNISKLLVQRKLHNFEINSFSRGNHSASYRVEYNLNS